MSEWGRVFVTHKSALIKELNHLFWIITLLSKGMAEACLRRNLICLSKNMDGNIRAQRNHGKRVMADRQRQLVWLTAISYLWNCVYFCLVELSVDRLAPCSVCHVSCKIHIWGNSIGRKNSTSKQQRCGLVYFWHFNAAFFLYCKCNYVSLMKFMRFWTDNVDKHQFLQNNLAHTGLTHWIDQRKIIPLRFIRSCKVHAKVTFLPYLLNLVSTDEGG